MNSILKSLRHWILGRRTGFLGGRGEGPSSPELLRGHSTAAVQLYWIPAYACIYTLSNSKLVMWWNLGLWPIVRVYLSPLGSRPLDMNRFRKTYDQQGRARWLPVTNHSRRGSKYRYQVKHERTDGRTTSALCPSFLEAIEAVRVVSDEQEHLLMYFDIQVSPQIHPIPIFFA